MPLLGVQQAPPPHSQASTPITIEDTTNQMESSRTNLEVFVKHVREYMVSHWEWEEYKQHSSQSPLPQHRLTVAPKHQALGVPSLRRWSSG